MEETGNQNALLGEDILSFSDSSGDEEAPLTKTQFQQPAVDSHLEVTSNGNDSGSGSKNSRSSRNSGSSRTSSRSNRKYSSQPYTYGSFNSPTSSLGNSTDYDRSEHDPVKKQIRSMNRGTIDALREGGSVLATDENRTLSTILLSVILTCAFSIVFMANSMTSSMSTNSTNRSTTYSSPDKMEYFPLPDGTTFLAGGGLSSAFQTSQYVPFETKDRQRDSAIPASEIIFPELFHSSLRFFRNSTISDASLNETFSLFPLMKVPIPTGAFWTNLVIKPTADRGFSYPIMTYPYAFKWNPTMMQISYPPLRRLTDDISIRDIFNPDMTFGTEEPITKRNVIRFDPLSVTLRFYGDQVNEQIEMHDTQPDPQTSYWETYLVQGSPYVTMKVEELTPVITALSIFDSISCPSDEKNTTDIENDVCMKKESKENPNESIFFGVQFVVKTEENLTWLVFASEPIKITLDQSKRNIRSTAKYSGIIRLALVPPPLEGTSLKRNGSKYESIPLSESIGVKRLIYHAHTYPVSSDLSWDFYDVQTSPAYKIMNANNREFANTVLDMMESVTVANINFDFNTRSMNDDIDKINKASPAVHDENLLMMALPHHAQVLPYKSIIQNFDLQYQCIKGIMSPVVGERWTYNEHLTNIDLDSDKDIKNIERMDDGTKQLILNQAELDMNRVLPTLSENVYGFGKQTARLSQLCHIVSHLEASDEGGDPVNRVGSLTSKCAKQLYDFLSTFLDGKVSDPLVYDINLGGIVSHDGFLDPSGDFGNGMYNDHHFHYGYILYACSIMGRLDNAFVENYGIHVDSIMYDIAHGANMDSDTRGGAFFPFTRHKSWFDSHSFASGLFPFADGKSQESSSEAVNCYYGAYLWSSLRWDQDEERVNFAKLLLAMELRGAKTYWHMLPSEDSDTHSSLHSSQLYNDKFEEGLMVGNLGMTDVTVATWFGTKRLYVHMINFMPVTAITKELFDEEYIQKEFEEIISPVYDNVEMAWRGYVTCDKAFTDPNGAWVDAQALRSYELDSALSQSQVYFWISTMAGFNITNEVSNATLSTANGVKDNSSCESNEKCAVAGLSGQCCPTLDNTMLQCCS